MPLALCNYGATERYPKPGRHAVAVTGHSFLTELQRRNAHRAVIPCDGAFSPIVQIAMRVFTALDIPKATLRIKHDARYEMLRRKIGLPGPDEKP